MDRAGHEYTTNFVLTSATCTTLYEPGHTFLIMPNSQQTHRIFSSCSKTRSPTLSEAFLFCNLVRLVSVGKYSFIHLFQKIFIEELHLFCTYTPSFSTT